MELTPRPKSATFNLMETATTNQKGDPAMETTTTTNHEGETTMQTKGDQLRAQARQKERDAIESFERCDTDGFLSQWASGLSAERLFKEAQIADDGGLAKFPALFDTKGNLVNARLIDGRYGECWMLLDEENKATGEFITAHPKRRATIFAKGYLEGIVKRPARVVITSGKGGMATAWATTVPVGDVTDEEVVVVTTDRWADAE